MTTSIHHPTLTTLRDERGPKAEVVLKNFSVKEEHGVDITAKYKSLLAEINAEIGQFNALLVKSRFDLLDMSAPGACLVVANIPWNELNLGMCPYSDCAGMYVLFGYQRDNPLRLAAYIGKSSIRASTISKRVYSHLSKSPERTTGTYTMNDLDGRSFVFEAVVAIGAREQTMRALLSALEEFVIDRVRGKLHLLNGSGMER